MSKAELQIAIRQRIMRLGRRTLPPMRRPRPPDAIARKYASRLLRTLMADVRKQLDAKLLPALPRLTAQAQAARGVELARTDAKQDRELGEILDEMVGDLLDKWTRERFTSIVQPFADETAVHSREQLMDQFRDALGVDVSQLEPWLGGMLDGFVRENVALIKSIPVDLFSQLEKTLAPQLFDGVRHEEIAKDVERMYGVSRRRAQLIARDQVGKLTGDLNRVRQVDLGVESYVWRTMRDNRVRDTHEHRDGHRYEWGKPPRDGHPGEAVLCRCFAEPDLGPLIAELTGERRPEVEIPDAGEGPAPEDARDIAAGRLDPGPSLRRREQGNTGRPRARPVPAAPRPVPAPPPVPIVPHNPTSAPSRVSTVEEAEAALAAVREDPTLVVERGGWKAERVYLVPLDELDDVVAIAWEPGRVPDIVRGYREGKELPPIKLTEFEGRRDIVDGNHRLAVARAMAEELGLKAIPVRFSDKRAAQIRLRPRGTSVVEEAIANGKRAAPPDVRSLIERVR